VSIQQRDAAIVGIHEFPSRDVEGELSPLHIKAESASKALADAGLTWSDVDGIYDAGEGGASGLNTIHVGPGKTRIGKRFTRTFSLNVKRRKFSLDIARRKFMDTDNGSIPLLNRHTCILRSGPGSLRNYRNLSPIRMIRPRYTS
jgi:hypothetical protein